MRIERVREREKGEDAKWSSKKGKSREVRKRNYIKKI